MLPALIQNYLEKCEKLEKGNVLRTIAKLTKSSNFEEATRTVLSALQYGACNGDSLLSLNERLYHNTPGLPPIKTNSHIPRLPPIANELAQYDAGLGKSVER